MTRRDGPRAEAEPLKAAVSLAAVIGETLPLKRAGCMLMGLCPFHSERTASFYVYPDHFHCFGCGAHGDMDTWLMQAHGLTFGEAIAALGGEGGRLPNRSVQQA